MLPRDYNIVWADDHVFSVRNYVLCIVRMRYSCLSVFYDPIHAADTELNRRCVRALAVFLSKL